MCTVAFKDQTAKDKALQHMAAMSSAQIVSATAIHNKLGLPGIPRHTFPVAPGVSHKLGLVAMAPEHMEPTWPSGKSSTWHFLLIVPGVREGKDHLVEP